MTAKEFIAEVSGREFPLWEFMNKYGLPEEVEREGEMRLLYECRDADVCLTVDRKKFNESVVEVIEGEPH